MSIYNCHRQQPQPWMSYISPNKIVYPGRLAHGNGQSFEAVQDVQVLREP